MCKKIAVGQYLAYVSSVLPLVLRTLDSMVRVAERDFRLSGRPMVG